DLGDGLAPGAGTDDQKAVTFIINLIVLRHEAERLGIQPSDAEIIEAVKKFPAFQGASGFDGAKYDQVDRTILPSLGFTDEQLRELAHDEVCLKRIKGIVVSGVSVPGRGRYTHCDNHYGKTVL